MSELSDSVAEAIRKRAVSATFGTYLFFWATFHWQGIYATLFTSQDLIYKKYKMLKNEYVNTYFFGWHGWPSFFGYFWPLILAVLFIWLLPKYVLIHAYRQEQRHKVDRRRVKIEEEEKLQIKKESLAIQEEKTLQAEIVAADKRQEAREKDPKIVWDEEYAQFQSSPNFARFGAILRSVYAFNGETYVSGEFELNPLSLKMADVNGLIQISNTGDTIKLTEKGKYFASKYDKDF